MEIAAMKYRTAKYLLEFILPRLQCVDTDIGYRRGYHEREGITNSYSFQLGPAGFYIIEPNSVEDVKSYIFLLGGNCQKDTDSNGFSNTYVHIEGTVIMQEADRSVDLGEIKEAIQKAILKGEQ